jgi:hypothetical protein
MEHIICQFWIGQCQFAKLLVFRIILFLILRAGRMRLRVETRTNGLCFDTIKDNCRRSRNCSRWSGFSFFPGRGLTITAVGKHLHQYGESVEQRFFSKMETNLFEYGRSLIISVVV